jgi:hypothetical protein
VRYIALCKLTAQLPGLRPVASGRWALIEEFLNVSAGGLLERCWALLSDHAEVCQWPLHAEGSRRPAGQPHDVSS